MDKKIFLRPKASSQRVEHTPPSPVETSKRTKKLRPADTSDIKGQTRSNKFRKSTEDVSPKNLPAFPESSRARTSPLSFDKDARHPSLKTIFDILPRDTTTSEGILGIAERAFDHGLPYFLARQTSSAPVLYRDASTIFNFLFWEQDTRYEEGTPQHTVWRKHVEDQEFLLFTGSNTDPVSMGNVYKMFADGLDDLSVGLLLTAANPKEKDFLDETKVLISFLYKINYMPIKFMPSHFDSLQGMTEDEQEAARLTLAICFSSVENSPMLVKLLDERVDLNKRDKRSGFVPLTTAIVNNARKNVELLIKLGAELRVDKAYLAKDQVLTDENRELVIWARRAVLSTGLDSETH